MQHNFGALLSKWTFEEYGNEEDPVYRGTDRNEVSMEMALILPGSQQGGGYHMSGAVFSVDAIHPQILL
jgi:hypothetical protein